MSGTRTAERGADRVHGWEWVLRALWNEDDDRRCVVNLPDTVLVVKGSADAPFDRWLFTSKSGVVSKKKDDNLTLPKLRRKFMSGGGDKVCTVYSSGSMQAHTLDRIGFDKLMNRITSGNAGAVCALQAVVAGGKGSRYSASLTSRGGAGGRPTWKLERSMEDGSRILSKATKKNEKLIETLSRVIRHVEDVQGVRVSSLSAELVMTGAEPQLLQIGAITCRKQAAGSTMVPLLAMKRDRQAAEASSARGGHTGGDGSPDSGGMWARHSAGPGSSASGGHKRGNLSASASLPVLGDSSSGVQCAGQFCGCSVVKVDTGVFAVRRPRSIATSHNAEFEVANKSVMLAKHTADFLTLTTSGSHLPGSDAEKAARWKMEDQRLQRQLGGRDPSRYYKQVQVCRACYAVYQDLAKLRRHGFRSMEDVVAAETASSSPSAKAAAAAAASSPAAQASARSERLRSGAMSLQRSPIDGATRPSSEDAGSRRRQGGKQRRRGGSAKRSGSRGRSRRQGGARTGEQEAATTSSSSAATSSSLSRGVSAPSGLRVTFSEPSTPAGSAVAGAGLGAGAGAITPPRTPNTGSTFNGGGLGMGSDGFTPRSASSATSPLDAAPGGTGGSRGGSRAGRGQQQQQAHAKPVMHMKQEMVQAMTEEQIANIQAAAFGMGAGSGAGAADSVPVTVTQGDAWGGTGEVDDDAVSAEEDGDEEEEEHGHRLTIAAGRPGSPSAPQLRVMTPTSSLAPNWRTHAQAGVPVVAAAKSKAPRGSGAAGGSSTTTSRRKGGRKKTKKKGRRARAAARGVSAGKYKPKISAMEVQQGRQGRLGQALASVGSGGGGGEVLEVPGWDQLAAMRDSLQLGKARSGSAAGAVTASFSYAHPSAAPAGEVEHEEVIPAAAAVAMRFSSPVASSSRPKLPSVAGAREVEAEEVPIPQRGAGRRGRRGSSSAASVDEELATPRSAGTGWGSEAGEVEEGLPQQLQIGGVDAAKWAEVVGRLQEEVVTLKRRLRGSSQKGAELQDQLRELSSRYSVAHRSFTKAMKEKDAAAERERLELEQRFNDEMAQARAAAPQDTSAGAKELLATIESLHKRYGAAEKAWAQAKADAEEQGRRTAAQLEASFTREKASMVAQNSTLEERIGQLQGQLTEMLGQVSLAQSREEAAAAKAKRVEDETSQLHEQVAQLQAHLADAQKLAPGGSDGRGKAEAVPASVYNSLKSTTDSHIRTLTNEVQYLKAQLASELTCKEELGSSLAAVNARFSEAAKEWRGKAVAAAEEHRQEVLGLQQQHSRELERPRAEIGNLEDKVMRLQMQLTEMAEDMAAARKREEEARGDVSAARMERDGAKNEMARLKHELEMLRSQQASEVEASQMSGAVKSAADAAVRRAQNEATFLRTQLNSEIRCKTELEDQLHESNAKLVEEVEKRRSDVAKLEQQLREVKRHEAKKLAMVAQAKLEAEAELVTLRQTAADHASSLERLRENQRTMAAALETKTASVAELEAQVAAANKESLAAKVSAGQAAARHKSSLEAAQAAVREITAAKDREIAKLNWEISEKLSKVSTTQKGMLQLRDEMEAAAADRSRSEAASRLFRSVQLWAANRRRAAFTHWRLEATARHQQSSAAKELEQKVHETKAAAKAEKENALRTLLTEFRDNKRKGMAKAKQRAEARLAECMAMAQAEAEAQAVRAEQRLAELAGKQKAAIREAIQATQEADKVAAAAAVAEAQRVAGEEAKALVARLTEERRAAVQQWEGSTRHEVEQALAEAIKEKRKAVKEAIAMTRKEMAKQLQQQHSASAEAVEVAVKAARQEWAAEAAAAQAQAEAQLAEAVEAEKAASRAAMAELEGKHRATLESVMRQALRDRESLVRDVLEDKAAAVAAEAAKGEAAVKAERQAREQAVEAARSDAAQRAADAVAQALTQQRAAVAEARAEGAAKVEAVTAELQRAAKEQASRAAADAAAATAREVGEAAKAREGELRRQLEVAAMAGEDAAAAAQRDAAAVMSSSVADLRRAAAEAQAEAVKRAQGEAAERMGELAAQLRAEGERRLAKAEAEAARKLEAALAEAEQQRAAAVAAFLEEAQAEQARLTEEKRAAVQAALEASSQDAAADLQRQLSVAKFNHEDHVQELVARAAAEKEQAVAEVREQAAAEQAEAMEELRAESESLLESIEEAMARVMKEKRNGDAALARTREALEEAEDANYDLEQGLGRTQKTAKLQSIALMHQMLRYVNEINKVKQQASQAMAEQRAELEARARREVALQARQANLVRDRLHELETMREAMQETLMNHKREVLMEHKVLSGNIQAELARIEEDKAAADERYQDSLVTVSELEGRVRMLENELREHAKQSAIGADGSVNVQHTRKKKRLDGEVERAIDRVAGKRDELNALKQRVQELEELRNEKEEQMRDIESTLVGVLVGQQRQLMNVLQSTAHKLVPDSLRAEAAQRSRPRSVRFREEGEE